MKRKSVILVYIIGAVVLVFVAITISMFTSSGRGYCPCDTTFIDSKNRADPVCICECKGNYYWGSSPVCPHESINYNNFKDFKLATTGVITRNNRLTCDAGSILMYHKNASGTTVFSCRKNNDN